ncbi:MAG: WhiB family transcriptional regulator [bacterium]|nr:WhiB family transcriptional regulator [bacterium]
MDWRHEAACRNEDPELFFPNPTIGLVGLQIETAKVVCKRCTVVDECLSFAVRAGLEAGVWGGLSEDERRAQHPRRTGQREPRVA